MDADGGWRVLGSGTFKSKKLLIFFCDSGAIEGICFEVIWAGSRVFGLVVG